MVRGYAKVVNHLFKLRNLSPPGDLSNPNNMTVILLNNMLREEDIARQCAPFDNKIFAKLRWTVAASKCKDSVSDLFFDIVALGCYIGPRLSKYARPLRIKLIIILIRLIKQLSKLSSPTTSSSTMRGSVLSRNWMKIPSNKPVLSRLLGIYKRTTRTANWLPSRQRVINPKYALCSAQCDWHYGPGGWISRMTCLLQYIRWNRVR